MKQRNLFTLLFLAAAVALWGLAFPERRSTKGNFAGKFIPTAFADVPESASGVESAESAESGSAEGTESAGCEAESGSCCESAEGGESGCAVTDFES